MKSGDALAFLLNDRFIMHYAFGDLNELGEAMRRALHACLKKDIKASEDIVLTLLSSFAERDF